MINVILPDYDNSILNVSATLLNHYGIRTIYHPIPELKEQLEKDPKHVFLLLLDGMGINIINRYLKRKDFLREHVVKTITSVFPSTTVAATNAVLTGKSPWSSGYLGWVQYLKDEDVYDTVFLNKDYYDSEKVFAEDFIEKYFKQPQITDLIKQANAEMITRQLFPNFKPNGFDTLSEELDEMVNISKTKEKTFTYIYWGEPDLTEHDYGPFSSVTKALLLDINQAVKHHAQALNEDSLLIVIADHGHQKVKPINLYQDETLLSMLDKLPTLEPRATSFFVKPEAINSFKSYFNHTYGKWYALYTKDELFHMGLLGNGEKHMLVDQCIGDYMAIAIKDRYFQFKDKKPFKGHHAGLTKHEMIVPLILYHKKKR